MLSVIKNHISTPTRNSSDNVKSYKNSGFFFGVWVIVNEVNDRGVEDRWLLDERLRYLNE